jgi:hypothetical protein
MVSIQVPTKENPQVLQESLFYISQKGDILLGIPVIKERGREKPFQFADQRASG